jgi:hypothetical protein
MMVVTPTRKCLMRTFGARSAVRIRLWAPFIFQFVLHPKEKILGNVYIGIKRYSEPEINTRLDSLISDILELVRHGNNVETHIAQYCRRRIDRTLKKIDLSEASSVDEIAERYVQETAALDINQIAKERRDAINQCIEGRDIKGLLALYDNKGLLNIVATQMKSTKKSDFENWVVRIFKSNNVPEFVTEIKGLLPKITAE